MFNQIIIVALLASCIATIDFCSVNIPNPTIYVSPQQTKLTDLSSIISGFALSYQTNDDKISVIRPGYKVVNDQPYTLQSRQLHMLDFELRNIDNLKADNKVDWIGFSSILIQSVDQKSIGIWTGEFQGYVQLPNITKFRKFDLPTKALCFDARLINSAGDVLVNCQGSADLFCYIKSTDETLTCQKIPSIFNSVKRKTAILNLKGKRFVLSANTVYNDEQDKKSNSYVAIYNWHADNTLEFNNIIDGSGLDTPKMEITGFEVAKDNSIILTDSEGSRLLIINYTLSNEIVIKKLVNLNFRPLALTYTKSNTIILASKDQIYEHNLTDLSIVSVYEIDSSDSLIENIMASPTVLAYTTRNKNLYIYNRNQHKINNLLSKQQIDDTTHLLLSQSANYLYRFTPNNGKTVRISSPQLQVGKISESTQLEVVATSSTVSCTVQVQIKILDNLDKIVDKDNLNEKSFKVDPLNGLSINLNDYYGGANLNYKYSTSANSDFDITLKHVDDYALKSSIKNTEQNAILQVDDTRFYYIGINTVKQSKVYIEDCVITAMDTKCVSKDSVKPGWAGNHPVKAVKTKIRSNGDQMIAWTYKYIANAEWTYLNKRGLTSVGNGQPYTYQSIEIGENKIYMLSKTSRVVLIFLESPILFVNLDEDYFSADELQKLEQFYPRQIYLNPSNDQIFYIKLLTSIATFIVTPDNKVKLLSVNKILDKFIPDDQWSNAVGQNSIITVLPDVIKQFTIEDYTLNQLFSIPNPQPKSKPIFYDSASPYAILVSQNDQTNQNTAAYLKHGQGSLGIQYHASTISGNPIISGNWIVSPQVSTISYVNANPLLLVNSNLPEDTFKQDLNININVESKIQKQQSKTKIEAVNYPIKISDVPNPSVINAPASANNLEIKIPVENYFSGPIAEYQLVCGDFCKKDNITLIPPLRVKKTVTSITAAIDFVEISKYLVTISNNVLYLLDSSQNILNFTEIKETTCTNLEYAPSFDLLVFCVSESSQQIRQFKLVQTDKYIALVEKDIFIIHDGPGLILNFDEMFAIEQEGSKYLIILDNDETIDSNRKKSTLKVYLLTDNLNFIKEIDSRSFNVEQLYPINDFTISAGKMFVTLGDYGIGYASLSAGIVFDNPNALLLSSIPEINQISVDGSFFKQVDVVNHTFSNIIYLFVSSTSSLSMVIALEYQQNTYRFKNLSEKYYRYGTQRLLNWHAITTQNIYLSYYNEATEVVTIVVYNRGNNSKIYFKDAVVLPLPKYMVKYHEAYITTNGQLMISQLDTNPSLGKIKLYKNTKDFTLVLNYVTPGTFENLGIVAWNNYYSVIHQQKIKFDNPIPPPPNPDSIKWYVVVLIVGAVLVFIGAAYGLFVYLKKRRGQKNVSLLTQKQEVSEDEIV